MGIHCGTVEVKPNRKGGFSNGAEKLINYQPTEHDQGVSFTELVRQQKKTCIQYLSYNFRCTITAMTVAIPIHQAPLNHTRPPPPRFNTYTVTRGQWLVLVCFLPVQLFHGLPVILLLLPHRSVSQVQLLQGKTHR